MMPPRTRSFPASASVLGEVRRFVEAVLQEAEMPTWAVDDLVMAAGEASTNAVLHAGTAAIDVSVRAKGGCAVVEVSDRGVFRDRSRALMGDGRVGGLGLMLMAALVDRVTVAKGVPSSPGTRVRLVRCAERGRDGELAGVGAGGEGRLA